MGYSRRATPDVSYDANPNTGFYIYDTYGYGGVMGVGGTSAGAPQWAALVAIADEMAGHNLDGASQTLPAIYNTAQSAYSSNFHDITSGTAGRNRAGTGFDLVTGWGSPIADSIVPALASDAPASDPRDTPTAHHSAADSWPSPRRHCDPGPACCISFTTTSGHYGHRCCEWAHREPSGRSSAFVFGFYFRVILRGKSDSDRWPVEYGRNDRPRPGPCGRRLDPEFHVPDRPASRRQPRSR